MAYQNFVQAYQSIITHSGDNPAREGLRDTPVRSAKAMHFFTQGYQQTVQDVVRDALFPSDNSDMVIVKDIEFYSLCEHHLLPFFGKVHIGYIPQGKVLGLSKFARITDVFAKRLQIQESLTLQIAQGIADITGASAVAVKIEASHMCMMMRGVQKQGAITVTQKMLGEFADNAQLRQEFMLQVQR